MKYLKNKTLQESVLLLAIGGWLVWYSLDGYAKAFNKDWSQSPFLFPIVVAGMMIVLAAVLFGTGLRSVSSKANTSKPAADAASLLRSVAVIGLCLVYYAALSLIRLPYIAFPLFGITLRFSTFELSTILFLAAMMVYLGVRKPKQLVLIPFCSTLFLSVMFRSLLHVILP